MGQYWDYVKIYAETMALLENGRKVTSRVECYLSTSMQERPQNIRNKGVT